MSLCWQGGGILRCLGLHNFGMRSDVFRRVAPRMMAMRTQAISAPDRDCSLMLGDWNFLASGEGYADQERPRAQEKRRSTACQAHSAADRGS